VLTPLMPSAASRSVRRGRAGRSLALVAVVAGLVVLCGCGTGADRLQVRQVTARFYSDLETRHGADACAQLNPALRKALRQEHSTSRCTDAVATLETQRTAVRAVRVYATSARVDLAGGESVFLSSMHDGWQISAFGCRPQPNGPYDCDEQA
jgi:hypothetical protein